MGRVSFAKVALVMPWDVNLSHQEKGQYYALAIGFCVVAGAYGAGVISGGAFNPAVAFSLDVTSTLDKTEWHSHKQTQIA